MAGIITHIALTDRILSTLPEGTIGDVPKFFCGNLAPDAVHSRAGYKREYKKHSHLRDGISDWDFLKPDMLALFRSRLGGFVSSFCKREDKNFWGYLGYVSHLIADEIYIRTVREDFRKKAALIGVTQRDPEFFNLIMHDMNAADRIMAEKYKFIYDVRSILREFETFDISGYISAKESSDSRDWILEHYFCEENLFGEPLYMTFDELEGYVERASKEIILRIKDIKIGAKLDQLA